MSLHRSIINASREREAGKKRRATPFGHVSREEPLDPRRVLTRHHPDEQHRRDRVEDCQTETEIESIGGRRPTEPLVEGRQPSAQRDPVARAPALIFAQCREPVPGARRLRQIAADLCQLPDCESDESNDHDESKRQRCQDVLAFQDAAWRPPWVLVDAVPHDRREMERRLHVRLAGGPQVAEQGSQHVPATIQYRPTAVARRDIGRDRPGILLSE